MGSGINQNGIINRGNGPIPGANQGPAADRPAVGNADGDWYLATDTKYLYKWDQGTLAWVVVLDGTGGTGGTPTLDQVLNNGNQTNREYRGYSGGVGIGTRSIFLDPIGSTIEVKAGTLDGMQLTATALVFFKSSGFALSHTSSNITGSNKAVNWRNLSGTGALLSDIPAVTTPTLQQVTTAGDTTTDDIMFMNGASLAVLIDPATRSVTVVNFPDSVTVNTTDVTIGQIGGTMQLIPATLSGTRVATFQDATGTVAYTSDISAAITAAMFNGNFIQAGFTGATITIAHGMGVTPRFATITAKANPTAGALMGGYFLTYTGVNIVVTLLVPVVGAIALNIDWFALPT